MSTPPSRRTRPPAPTPLVQVPAPPDVVTLTHLRWDFVFQRPQHLLTRCARLHRVFVIEEPLWGEGPDRLDVSVRQHGIHVVVPKLRQGVTGEAAAALQSSLLRSFFHEHGIRDYL